MSRNRKHRHPLPSIVLFELCSCIICGTSLIIPTGLPRMMNHPRTNSASAICSILKSRCGHKFEGEGRREGSLLRAESQPTVPTQRQGPGWNQCLAALRTALTAFCAGSLTAVLLSMVIFSSSLSSNDNQRYVPFFGWKGFQQISSKINNAWQNIEEVEQLNQKSVSLYRNILGQLEQRYVDEVEPMSLFETTTRAMLSTLDPYTMYISPQDIVKRQQLVGIGAFVMKAGDSPEFLDGKAVSSLMANVPSPVALPTQLLRSTKSQGVQNNDGYRVVLSLEGYAYDAGLRVGDVILGIDNQSIVGDSASIPTLEKVRDLLKGPNGTKVNITFKRPGIDTLQSIDLERKQVEFPDVPYSGTLDNDSSIGYIKLQRFGRDAGKVMQKALLQMKDQHVSGLILDLRDNSGGELFSAVQIASLFFRDGTFLGSSEGNGSMYPNEVYYSGKLDLRQYGYSRSELPSSENDGIFFDGKQIIDPDDTKIIILTNKRTASAAEFLSGVFQDLDKAIIIGADESTLGKGIGQREMWLPDGGALKLTYHEFYTPSGRCVQRKQYQNGPVHNRENIDQVGKAFHTKNGRLINDRQGIEVDYMVEPKTSLLNAILSSSGAYFAFATEFCARHNQASHINADLVVNDEVYADFKSFVVKEERRGNLNLLDYFDEQHLLRKIAQLSDESNHDSTQIQRSLAILRRQVVQDLLDDFDTCNEIIRFELEQNILARQLSQSELIQRSLQNDDCVKEAVSIIDDANRFRSLLATTPT